MDGSHTKALSEIAHPRRRDVLQLGAALAFAPSVAWARSNATSNLAVAYRKNASSVVAATDLGSGSRELGNRVCVTVHGLVDEGAGLADQGIRSLDLLVGYSPADGTEPAVEYRAWSHELLPVENTGMPVRFLVPVHDGNVSLALEIETFGSERHEAVLSTGREPGVAKLRAGDYLIAPGRSFDWRRVDTSRPAPLLALTVEPYSLPT